MSFPVVGKSVEGEWGKQTFWTFKFEMSLSHSMRKILIMLGLEIEKRRHREVKKLA